MSLMASVLVRPAGPSQRLNFCSCTFPASLSRWKPSELCPVNLEVIGYIDGSRKRIVSQAGLGRYSGAIHGSRSKKSWRRNPSNEQTEKEQVSDLHLFDSISSLEDMCGGASDGLLMNLLGAAATELLVTIVLYVNWWCM